MSESLYRKYRPQVFGDVVGQDHIIKTLQNSISANKVSHAYLFCGPRGTGKTTTARILAKALLCEKGPTVEPDGTCEDCQMIAKSVHPDVSELDAASRTGVENVRDEIISRVGYAPVRGQYKVYVIDEVHMLSNAAFNALLKTLEEPPAHIVFVLCTTDPQKVPETIRSRCQRFDFRAINTEELTGRLGAVCEMENVSFEGEALELIAQRSNGGLRDALTALEQTIAFGDNHVSLSVAQDMFGKTDVNDLNDLVKSVAEKNINKCLEFIEAKVNDGVDFAQFVDDFAQRMRDVYVMRLTNCDISVSESKANVELIKEEAKLFDEAQLSYTLSLMHDLSVDLKTASNQRLAFELGIFKMLEPHSSMTFEAIDARLSALESGSQVIASANQGFSDQVLGFSNGSRLETSTNPSIGNQKVDKSTDLQEDAPTKTYNLKPKTSDSWTVSSAPTPPTPSSTTEEENLKPKTYNLKPNAESVPPASDLTDMPVGKIDFRSIWKRALDQLRTSNPAIFSLLDSAHGSFNQPSKTITLKLEEGRTFAYNNLSKPASKTAIIASLEKAGLAGAKINVVMLEGENPSNQGFRDQVLGFSNGSQLEASTNPSRGNQKADKSTDLQEAAPTTTYNLKPKTSEEDALSTADDVSTDDVTSKTYNLKPNTHEGEELNAGPIPEPTPESQETLKSEIDEFNDILASTFGEGAHFEEVN